VIDVVIVSRLATVRAGLRALLAGTAGLRVVADAALLDAATVDGPNDVGGPDDVGGVVLLDAATFDEIDDAADALAGAGVGLVVLGPAGGLRRLLVTAPPFAWAFLARDAATERIAAAVRAVAAGLVAYEAGAQDEPRPSAGAGPLPDATDPGDLTPREHEVLALVALGLTNKAVAQRLGISEHTVKFHVASILAKLAAESRTEAVNVAVRRGLLAL